MKNGHRMISFEKRRPTSWNGKAVGECQEVQLQGTRGWRGVGGMLNVGREEIGEDI